MRAIVLEKFGGLDSLVYKDIPEPEPKAGHVVIQIKAFGINHAEMHMRRGEWAEAAEVSGIECVGLVKSCPGGEFPVGAKVAALMGGLGRTINGSYAEYTRAPASNVARSSNRTCPGPSLQRFLKPTRLLGPVCSAISRSKKANCSSSVARPPHSARPLSRWPSTPAFG
jgi:NADPH:quinone reductase-like Zn-dependent oxidoreductase